MDKISFDAYNEGDYDEFEAVVERYHERFGYYSERIFAGKLYRNRKNRELCKRYGIRLSDPKLGKTGENHMEDVKNNISFEKKLALMGLWLHARQDKWAHGLYEENRTHTNKSDNIEYDYRSYMDKKTKKHKYKKIKYKKLLKKNKRLKETIKNTKDYLKIAKAALKRKYNEDFKHNKYIGKSKLNKRIDKYFHGVKYGFPLVVVDDKMRNKDVK